MASTTFYNVIYGDQHVNTAWDEAVERDQYLHGNDGATGDVGSVHGFNVRHPEYRLTESLALDYAEDSMGQVVHWDKWAPAEAIPFYKANRARYGKPREKEVTVTVEKPTDPFWSANARMAELAKRTLFEEGCFKQGEIISVSLVSRELQKPRVEKLSTRGAAQTRYFITQHSGLSGTWDTGFTSLSLARAELEQRISDGRISGHVEIVARTARQNGAPLTAMNITQLEKITVKVTWQKELDPAYVTEERLGWLFYGRANS